MSVSRFDATTLNSRGEYVPAIPYPLALRDTWKGKVRCECGEVRKGLKAYREHYALAHILGLDN